MNIIKYRNLFFVFSLLVIVPGIVAFFAWNLKLGIDFTGGTLWEINFTGDKITAPVSPQEIAGSITADGGEVSQANSTGSTSVLLRLKVTDDTKIKEIKTKLSETYGTTEDVRLETVGPTISRELTQKAFLAVGISILAILTFITWSFRKIPKPASSLAFGICTVISLVHDVIVVVGVFAILGHFINTEVDSLFITAILTVIGFSVHDTIVVFDRIRENLIKHSGYSFEEVVNHSLLQTMGRSLNTSLTAVFVLIALLLFGGDSIKTFVLALLVGIISGTYSSIFNAAPLLVVWSQLANAKRRS